MSAFSDSLGARTRAREARSSQSVHGRKTINSLPDPRWDTWFQMNKEAGVKGFTPDRPVQQLTVDSRRVGMPAPYHPTGPNAVRARPAIDQRDLAMHSSNMPITTYGADAELARKQRQLALSALDAGMEQTRVASEPQFMRAQRSNLASHGTIEEPYQFKRRTGGEEAAELTDPSTPRGALAEQEFGRKLEGIYRQNVLPAQIAGQSRVDVAGINQDADRYVADSRLQASQGSDLASRRAAALRALSAMFGFDESDLSEDDIDIRRGVRREAGF